VLALVAVAADMVPFILLMISVLKPDSCSCVVSKGLARDRHVSTRVLRTSWFKDRDVNVPRSQLDSKRVTDRFDRVLGGTIRCIVASREETCRRSTTACERARTVFGALAWRRVSRTDDATDEHDTCVALSSTHKLSEQRAEGCCDCHGTKDIDYEVGRRASERATSATSSLTAAAARQRVTFDTLTVELSCKVLAMQALQWACEIVSSIVHYAE